MHKKPLIVPASRPRNPLGHDPLLRKGGPHGKSRKAERRLNRQTIRRDLPALLAEQD